MVIELSVEELSQGCNVVHLGFLDVLHTTKDIFAGLLKFGLVHANFFFDAKIVAASLLQLVGAGIVGETAVLKLLAGALLLLAGVSSSDRLTYLIFSHHRQTPLEVVQPSSIGAVYVGILDTTNALVGATQGQQAVSELGLLLKVLTVGSHCTAKSRHRSAALLVIQKLIALGQPFNIAAHRSLHALHTWGR
jgi:hypothetical protein